MSSCRSRSVAKHPELHVEAEGPKLQESAALRRAVAREVRRAIVPARLHDRGRVHDDRGPAPAPVRLLDRRCDVCASKPACLDTLACGHLPVCTLADARPSVPRVPQGRAFAARSPQIATHRIHASDPYASACCASGRVTARIGTLRIARFGLHDCCASDRIATHCASVGERERFEKNSGSYDL